MEEVRRPSDVEGSNSSAGQILFPLARTWDQSYLISIESQNRIINRQVCIVKHSPDYSNYPNKVELEQDLLHEPQYPGSAYMVFDFDPESIFGTRGRVPVILTIDGKKFRRSFSKYAGQYMMVFNAELREATGYKAGDKIKILMERDFEPRILDLPPDFKSALHEAAVMDEWNKWSYSHQKEDLAWILEAKKPETRQKRIAKLIELLRQSS